MKYTVVIEDSADADLRRCFEWGVRKWGKRQAEKWFREMIREIRKLEALPGRCAIAPDTDEFAETIRKLLVGRYRVLFTIRSSTVHILHVRAPMLANPQKNRAKRKLLILPHRCEQQLQGQRRQHRDYPLDLVKPNPGD